MNREVARKWVDALRSGEYEQGHLRLHADGKFCCLGVLCDISGLGEWKTDVGEANAYFGSFTVLPREVREWAGFDRENPLVAGIELAVRNDGWTDVDPHTFAEIADLIEKEWLNG